MKWPLNVILGWSDVEEISAAQVLVRGRLAGRDPGRVDPALERRVRQRAESAPAAVDVLEEPAHPRDHHVSCAELGLGVAGFKIQLAISRVATARSHERGDLVERLMAAFVCPASRGICVTTWQREEFTTYGLTSARQRHWPTFSNAANRIKVTNGSSWHGGSTFAWRRGVSLTRHP